MRVVPSELPEVLIIEADVYRDGRGFFLETYHKDKFRALGIEDVFVQDNHSKSAKHTVRGLHLQVGRPQAKLVRVVEGEIYDVAVDVRRGSPTFGRWCANVLSADNFRLCYVPSGFAHGFSVRTETAQVEYKCSDIYDPPTEVGIAWNDPQIGIDWGVAQPILSERDRQNRPLADIMGQLPVYTPKSPR